MKYAVVAVLLASLQLTGCGPRALDPQADRAFTVLRNQLASTDSTLELREGRVSTEAGDYYYVEMGSGPLLLLYHGYPSFWFAWKPVLPALAAHFRVVAVDGLGANLSAKPEGLDPYRVPALAEQLHALLDELAGEQPVYLAGHDWGGALVWSFAQAYPDRVAAMAVLSAPPLNLFLDLLAGDPQQQKASAYVERLKGMLSADALPDSGAARLTDLAYGKLLADGHIDDADYAAFGRGLAQPGALRATTSWYAANVPEPDAIVDADFWPSRQASAPVPSLLIWGGRDRTFVERFLERAGDYATPLRIEVLPEAGHWPMFEEADATRTLMLEFFLEHVATPAASL